MIIIQLAYCILKLSALLWCHAPSDFSVLKNLCTKTENACRTGCKTAVWISLPKNVAFKFAKIEPSGLLRLGEISREQPNTEKIA